MNLPIEGICFNCAHSFGNGNYGIVKKFPNFDWHITDTIYVNTGDIINGNKLVCPSFSKI